MTNVIRLAGVACVLTAGLLGTAVHATEVKETWYMDYASAGPFTSGRSTVDRVNGGYTFTNTSGFTTTVSGWFGDEHTGMTDVSQYLKHWSGLSLDRPSYPNNVDDDYGDDAANYGDDRHTIDNSGYDEFVVFEFSEAVSFHSFSIAYKESDSDATVMYLDPSVNQSAAQTLAGKVLDDTGANSITAAGWNVLGQKSNLYTKSNAQHAAGDTSTGSHFDTSIKSKAWAVAAYLVSMDSSSHPWSAGNDGFKLNALSITRHVMDEVPAPVPATLTLFLAGIFIMRRRQQGSVTA